MLTLVKAFGVVCVLLQLCADPVAFLRAAAPPSLEEILGSKEDVWANLALKQTNGPSYEFFAPLLPPPRYVNSDFRYYPIVLSAPRGSVKARLISNGSGLNLPGGARSWHDVGTAVTFRVGPDELRFGDHAHRLSHPSYAEGFLPIVAIDYQHGESTYRQEAFAAVDPAHTEQGIVYVQFSLKAGTNGSVALTLEGKSSLELIRNTLRDSSGKILLWLSPEWKWTRGRVVGTLKKNTRLTIAVATRPADEAIPSPLTIGYAKARAQCAEEWKALLTSGMRLQVPEERVQRAWQALLAGNYMLIHTNRMHYSSGNQYDRLYQGEGCDAVNSLLLWGHEVGDLIISQLHFTRKGLEYHQAGHKLLLLAEHMWRTGNKEFIREQEKLWRPELARIVENRKHDGLFPREQYCGDVATPVFSLNSNAKAWRAWRDFSVALEEAGMKPSPPEDIAEFRAHIVRAVEKSRAGPFVPIALSGEEKPYDPITGTKIGSYWNLMANYVLGARVFGPGSQTETDILRYVEQHGGLCMGLIRSRPAPTFWTGLDSINPLYGLRRTLALLERDEPDLALAGFYGMLAQGFTRDTFISGEGISLRSLDGGGRLFYCPPNSAANAFWLTTLRTMLVQDWDLDDDGKFETLRLLYATPRVWLEHGKSITVERAPTAFGDVSLRVQSFLQDAKLRAQIDLPTRKQPKHTVIRFRAPAGWEVGNAAIDGEVLHPDQQGSFDLSGRKGTIKMTVSVRAI